MLPREVQINGLVQIRRGKWVGWGREWGGVKWGGGKEGRSGSCVYSGACELIWGEGKRQKCDLSSKVSDKSAFG